VKLIIILMWNSIQLLDYNILKTYVIQILVGVIIKFHRILAYLVILT